MSDYDREQAQAQQRYEELRRRSVNPPYNPPKPLPPHLHDPPGFNAQCGLCCLLQERARQEHPERFADKAQAQGQQPDAKKQDGEKKAYYRDMTEKLAPQQNARPQNRTRERSRDMSR